MSEIQEKRAAKSGRPGRAILAATAESNGPYAFYLAIKSGASAEQQRRLSATFFLTSDQVQEARAAAGLPDWSEEDSVYLVA